MKVRSTKKALIASILMLAICFTSLIGTTFAWFTDSVSSDGNKIVAGTLDIDLVDANGDTLAGEMIEWAAKDGRAQEEIFWEPGCTYETEEFYIVNNGNLNLKFKFNVTGITGDAKLLEVMDFSCMAKAEWFKFNTGAISIDTSGEFDLLKGFEYDTIFYGVQVFDEYVLEPGDKVGPIKLQGHMDELAGNEYMGLSIDGIAVSLIATQATGDEDSFDGAYDDGATYSHFATGSAIIYKDTNGDLRVQDTETDSEGNTKNDPDYVYMREKNSDNLVGSVYIPSDGIDPNATSIDAVYQEIETAPNFTVVKDGYKVKSYEITVTGIQNDPALGNVYKVEINVGAGLGDVEVYHYNDLIANQSYNNSTGILTFETTSFSPFNVMYNGIIVPPTSSDLPTQDEIVSEDDVAKYENVNLEWSSFGPISKLPHGYQLQSVYKFKAPADVSDSIYKDWYCDYYVSVSEEVKEGTIVLGGNYGSFGWVGFENPVDVPEDVDIPLLGFFADPENPRVDVMTYADVVAFVGEFICGVSYMDASVAGTEFTVKLRLTNPENYDEFIDVATIVYTFGEGGTLPMDVVENAKDPTVFEDIA